jgi:hypothetical protein
LGEMREHSVMGKRISVAVLWGLAVWTWMSMIHVVMGIPDVGFLAGAVTIAAIFSRSLMTAQSPASADKSLATQRS